MSLFLGVWFFFGLFHFCDYMIRYNDMRNPLDFVVLLPFMLLCGPLTTVRKIFP